MINDRYKIKKQIGKGSFANVSKGKDIVTNNRVAIKMCEQENPKSYSSEIAAFKKLSGKPNFPKLFWSGTHQNKQVFVMQLLGKSLSNLYWSHRLDLTEKVEICIQMISALQTMHQSGIVHRDLKPDNILCGRKKDKNYYLIDYGLSKQYNDEKTKCHYPQLANQKFRGNLVFCSSHALSGIQSSRRDDIISIILILIFLMKNGLPWMKNAATIEDMIGQRLLYDSNFITAGLPNEVIECYFYSISLSYYQTPDYDWLRAKLNRCKIFFDYAKKDTIDIKNIKNKKHKTKIDRNKSVPRPSILRSRTEGVPQNIVEVECPTIKIDPPDFSNEFRKIICLRKNSYDIFN